MPADPGPGSTEIDGARAPDASPGPDVAVPDADLDPRAEEPDVTSTHDGRPGDATRSSDGDDRTGAGPPPREPSDAAGDETVHHGVRADLASRGSHD